MDIELDNFKIEMQEKAEIRKQQAQHIKNEYKVFLRIVENEEAIAKLNKINKLKNLLGFASTCADQIYDIFVLITEDRHASIENVLRAICENYGIFILLYSNFSNDIEFETIVEFLHILDTEQNNKILLLNVSDPTSYGHKASKIDLLKQYIKNRIDTKFPAYSSRINEASDMEFCTSIKIIVKDLKNKRKYNANSDLINLAKDKSKFVSDALLNNDAWRTEAGEQYVGADSFYGSLCRATHCNISSVIQRIRSPKGIFVLNMPTDNTMHLIALAALILKDINNKIKPLLS